MRPGRRRRRTEGAGAAPARPEEQPTFVFVVTYGRSGSTLVTGLLNALPGTVVRGENGFYALELFEADRCAADFAELHAHHRPRRVESAFYGAHLVTPDRLAALERELLLGLLVNPERRHLPRRVGFKEVLWHRIPREDTDAFFAWFERVFPGARYVLNTRDMEAASTSGFWRSYDRDEAMEAMRRVVEIQDHLRSTRPDRVIDTRYEAITSDDETVRDGALTELASFVLGSCSDEVLDRMRQVLQVGYGPNPFGASRRSSETQAESDDG